MQKYITLNKQVTTILLASILATVIICHRTSAQNSTNFYNILSQFTEIPLPIDSVHLLKPGNLLITKAFNDVFWNSQRRVIKNGKESIEKPSILWNGKLIELNTFGKIDDSPMEYVSKNGMNRQFYQKVFAVGRINIDPNYLILIVKTINSETSYFDMYSFNHDGIRISAIPLCSYLHKSIEDNRIDYLISKATISSDGIIFWKENNRGIKTKRKYQLNHEGYFEVIAQQKSGEFEY